MLDTLELEALLPPPQAVKLEIKTEKKKILSLVCIFIKCSICVFLHGLTNSYALRLYQSYFDL